MKGKGVGVLIFLIPVAVIFGACALAVAKDKGRSGIGYFLFGLAAGPIGLLAAILAEPELPTPRDGWTAVWCIRCGKTQNVELEPREFTCWQCQQHNEISRYHWAYGEQRPAEGDR